MKNIFALALAYTGSVVQLGAMYHTQDRSECPELWIKHDEAYKTLLEACGQKDLLKKLEEVKEIAERQAQEAGATQFVNVLLSPEEPHNVIDYFVSDFCDNATVCSFYNDEEQ